MTRSTSYLRVRFIAAEVFLDELRADRELVERNIVRLRIKHASRMNGTVRRVTVEAGAIVDGRPVYLTITVGDLWGTSDDTVITEAAATTRDGLETALRELDLEPRAGILEENTGEQP